MKLHQNLNFDIVTFDFDGVIVDSNFKKEDALKEIIKLVFGASERKVCRYLTDNPGRNRNYYFNYFIQKKISGKYKENILNYANVLFSDQVKKIYKNAKVQRCLNEFKKITPNSTWFVLSSASSLEIEIFLKESEMSHLFHGVLGGPQTKVENYTSVISLLTLDSDRVLHVGDGNQDILLIDAVGINGLLLTEWSAEPERLIERSGSSNVIVSHSLCDFCRSVGLN